MYGCFEWIIGVMFPYAEHSEALCCECLCEARTPPSLFFAFLKSLLVFAEYSENNGNSDNSDAGPLKQRPEQVVAHQRQEDHGNNGKGLCKMSQPEEKSPK